MVDGAFQPSTGDAHWQAKVHFSNFSIFIDRKVKLSESILNHRDNEFIKQKLFPLILYEKVRLLKV